MAKLEGENHISCCLISLQPATTTESLSLWSYPTWGCAEDETDKSTESEPEAGAWAGVTTGREPPPVGGEGRDPRAPPETSPSCQRDTERLHGSGESPGSFQP